MQPRVTFALKALIAALLALLLFVQAFLVPVVAHDTAIANPDLAYLRIPGIVAAVFFLALVEIVLVCIWRLLSLVRAEEIFSPRAFTYVHVIIAAMLAASIVIAASLVVLFVAGAVNPGILVLGVLGIVVGIALALLVVVLRGLLGTALALEQDMAEVV